MNREQISDVDIEKVVGGSIIFSPDHTTCGRNCNNQYKVLNYSACNDFIADNCTKLSEKKMLAKMEDLGYISKL